jgi:hypothetical protein
MHCVQSIFVGAWLSNLYVIHYVIIEKLLDYVSNI